MASKKQVGRPKKVEAADSSSNSSEEEKKTMAKKGRLQKNKSSEKIDEKGGKKMPPISKMKKDKKSKAESESSSDDFDYAPPKKPLNAYVLYSQALRSKAMKENPDAKPKEIMGIVGKMWKKASDNDKAIYLEMADKEKARYQRQTDEFETHGKFYDDDGNVVKVEVKRKRSVSAKKNVLEKKKPTKKNK